MAAVYWSVTRPAVRRAMSLQDFNPASTTFGCCDRTYWQYRTISSFPAATMQQVALPFAILFDTAFDGNEWHHQETMLERARAAMLFWARCQHPSGSVDEWYRNEHSYCATAFTTFGMAESCLRLHTVLPPSDRNQILRALRRAAEWLGDRFNDDVMNQNLAASAALWNVHQLTGDRRFKTAFEKTWAWYFAHQDPEGWFAEYGGADLGTSLLALDLLAALDARGCAGAAAAAVSLSRFVSSFAVGGSDLAGRLGSRGTDHSFPFGAEFFAPAVPAAAAVAEHLRAAIDANSVSDPRVVDDRYLAYFYLPSFVLASAVADRGDVGKAQVRSATFDSSGFRVWRRRGGDLICSTRRNAAFNLYAPPLPVHRNFGYWLEAVDGRRFASCGWSTNTLPVEEHAGGLGVQGRFVRVDDSLPLVRHDVAFRAATNWLFRWPFIAEPFHRLVKRRKITRPVAAPIDFTRDISWSDDSVSVMDRLRARTGVPVLRAVTPAADIDVHSPSARQSGTSPTDVIVVSRSVAEGWAERINRSGTLTFITSYTVDGDGRLKWTGTREEQESVHTHGSEGR